MNGSKVCTGSQARLSVHETDPAAMEGIIPAMYIGKGIRALKLVYRFLEFPRINAGRCIILAVVISRSTDYKQEGVADCGMSEKDCVIC